MDVSTVIRKAQRRFGDSSSRLVTQTDLFDFIDDAQMQIVRATGDITVTTDVAASTYPVVYPANFIRGERIEYGGRPLDIITKDDLDANYIDVTEFRDEPMFYYYFAGSVHLWPDPEATDSTSVKFTYWGTPTAITSTGTALTVPVSYHEDIVTFVVARCHERNENWAMYDRLMNEFSTGLGLRTEEAKVKDDTYPVIRDDPQDNVYL
jgi:hypothetical protein